MDVLILCVLGEDLSEVEMTYYLRSDDSFYYGEL